MQTVIILVYHKHLKQAITDVLDGFFASHHREKLKQTTYLYHTTLHEADQPQEEIRNLIFTDFAINLTMIYLPEKFQDYLALDTMQKHLPHLPPGEYTFEAILLATIKENRTALTDLKLALSENLTTSDITTLLSFADNNMNVLKTSRALYIHRNTLNYRLEAINEKIAIDIKTFKGLTIIELCFGQ